MSGTLSWAVKNDMNDHDPQQRRNPVWAFLSSIRLTIILLIILALASVIGTLVPQREDAVEFARRISPELFSLLSTLDIFDMYHSTWFRLLIGFLALNLTVCSIDRFPRTWKRFSALPRPDRQKPFEDLPQERSFVVRAERKSAAASVVEYLKGRYKRIRTKETESAHFIYGEKGRFSHFGVYLVHLSILIIIIGGLLGSFLGFEAYVNIAEGEKTRTVILRNTMKPLDLGFEVRCDRFFVDFYRNGAPKEYRSDLTFLLGGQEVEKASALVNHPVHFRGITFYQSSYGVIPKVRIRVSRHASQAESRIVELEQGDQVELPGGGGEFSVTRFSGNFMNRFGPAVRILVRPIKGREIRFWVVKEMEALKKILPAPIDNFPGLDPSAFKPYTFSFMDRVKGRYYTGLQVNRDPGVPLVWAGCFLMMAGFFVTFFTSHKRIWVRVSGHDTGVRVSVAGTANKNPVGLERELDKVTREIGRLFKKG